MGNDNPHVFSWSQRKPPAISVAVPLASSDWTRLHDCGRAVPRIFMLKAHCNQSHVGERNSGLQLPVCIF